MTKKEKGGHPDDKPVVCLLCSVVVLCCWFEMCFICCVVIEY